MINKTVLLIFSLATIGSAQALVSAILDEAECITKIVTTPVAPITDPVVEFTYDAVDAVLPPVPVLIKDPCCPCQTCAD